MKVKELVKAPGTFLKILVIAAASVYTAFAANLRNFRLVGAGGATAAIQLLSFFIYLCVNQPRKLRSLETGACFLQLGANITALIFGVLGAKNKLYNQERRLKYTIIAALSGTAVMLNLVIMLLVRKHIRPWKDADVNDDTSASENESQKSDQKSSEESTEETSSEEKPKKKKKSKKKESSEEDEESEPSSTPQSDRPSRKKKKQRRTTEEGDSDEGGGDGGGSDDGGDGKKKDKKKKDKKKKDKKKRKSKGNIFVDCQIGLRPFWSRQSGNAALINGRTDACAQWCVPFLATTKAPYNGRFYAPSCPRTLATRKLESPNSDGGNGQGGRAPNWEDSLPSRKNVDVNRGPSSGATFCTYEAELRRGWSRCEQSNTHATAAVPVRGVVRVHSLICLSVPLLGVLSSLRFQEIDDEERVSESGRGRTSGCALKRAIDGPTIDRERCVSLNGNGQFDLSTTNSPTGQEALITEAPRIVASYLVVILQTIMEPQPPQRGHSTGRARCSQLGAQLPREANLKRKQFPRTTYSASVYGRSIGPYELKSGRWHSFLPSARTGNFPSGPPQWSPSG
ncbi:hypothetical protein TTRE_0000384501 [Trichuris trichiura]|uniref:Uncharacterized protein n=1 Tax=Trichuris trichiura TaxID=36087 RepID=A0A077Z502_TRITR|nr:hypothetical protein TTRE_0000384501 [Trichuris trichiura]